MSDPALLRQVEGFSLTTAEILYRLPDYPPTAAKLHLAGLRLAPHFPKLVDFLDFWICQS